jgi:hypothetical protein
MMSETLKYSVVRAIAIAALCWSCGSSKSAQGQPGDAAAASDQQSFETICNGANAIRLVYRFVGGGTELPGKRVLSENGYEFLLIDGRCRYWALKDQYSDVRQGELSASDAAALEHDLNLPAWTGLQGDYTVNLCDGTAPWLRFAETRIRIHAACDRSDNAARVIWLQDVVRHRLALLYERAQPFAGPIRLVLVSEANDVTWPPLVEQAKTSWPARQDPASWALTLSAAENYVAGSSRLVEGPDAALLREAKRRFYEGGGIAYSGGFVPVIGPRGERYQLYLRDSIPLEDSSGLLHVD